MAGMRKFGTITTISKFLLVDVQVIRSLAHVQNISKNTTVMSLQPLSLAAKNTRTSGKKYFAAKSIPSPPCSMTDQKPLQSQPELDKYPPLLVNWGVVHPGLI